MVDRLPVELVLDHASAAQAHLESVVADRHDADVAAPSALDGWTIGHVLTHLARNADSQIGMLEGVARGKIVPQYPGGDAQRDGDIDAGAGRPLAEQQADIERGHRLFLLAAASLSGADWDRPVVSRLGRFPAWFTVWARWREVEMHTDDLGLPPRPGAPRLSDAFVAQFLPPELERLPGRVPPPHDVAVGAAFDLTGEPAEQLLWLTGRAASSVRLTVDGVEVDQDALAPWPPNQWIPGGAEPLAG